MSRFLYWLCIVGVIVGSAFALVYAFGATMTALGLSAERRTPHDIFLMIVCGGLFVVLELLASWLLRSRQGASASSFRGRSKLGQFGIVFLITLGIALVIFVYMFVTEV